MFQIATYPFLFSESQKYSFIQLVHIKYLETWSKLQFYYLKK